MRSGSPWADPGVLTPSPPPLKNLKNIGFLCNIGPDPLKNHKIYCWAIIGRETSFNGICWRAYDVPFIAVFGSSIPSSTKRKKMLSNLDPLRLNFWICVWSPPLKYQSYKINVVHFPKYSRLSLTQLCITQYYHLSRPDGLVPVFSPIYYCNSTTFISTMAKSIKLITRCEKLALLINFSVFYNA